MTLLIGFMTIPALLGPRVANLESQVTRLTYEVSHQSAVDSLRALNAALARYKAVMGKYPVSMEQLSSPDDCSHPPDCNRFLEDLKFLSTEKYFTLRYRVSAPGYEINADARSGHYQSLGHYFTDQTGIIRYDERDANAKSRYVPEDARITFN